MAGVAFPTFVLLVAMTVFSIARYAFGILVDVERVIIFPLTVVPNLWGFANVVYIGFLARRRVPIGVFGALLPLLLIPGGAFISRLLPFSIPVPVWSLVPFFFPIAMVVYYLLWKHLVATLNEVVGLG
jgi:hypothetical protein